MQKNCTPFEAVPNGIWYNMVTAKRLINTMHYCINKKWPLESGKERYPLHFSCSLEMTEQHNQSVDLVGL
jgi:hypothetical protein